MDKYAYREYSNDYPRLFEIEHIGSTAVVGLGGKGILDVGIGVAVQDRFSAQEQLSRAGYEYREKASTASRGLFRADSCDGRDITRAYADAEACAANEAAGDGSRYIALKDAVLQKVLRLAMEGSDDEQKL